MAYNSFKDLAEDNGLTPEEQHQELVECFYNMYKSANGMKPRHVDTCAMSINELVAEIEDLAVQIDDEQAEYERQRECRAQAEADYRRGYALEDIATMFACGAKDMAQAVRWAKQV